MSLADGNTVTLENAGGESVSLSLLVDFRDFIPDARLRVRQANPFAGAVVGSLTADDLAELGFTGTIDDANVPRAAQPRLRSRPEACASGPSSTSSTPE